MTPGLALFAAVLAVSWGAILARLCVSAPLAIAFYRLALSTLIVYPFAAWPGRGRLARVPRRLVRLIVLSGLLLALHFAAWITSLEHTSVGSSVLLVSTQPLFGLWLSRIFLGEAASRKTVLAVGVCLAGTAVIVWGDLSIGPDRRFGDLLALAGAAFAAGYLLIGRRLRDRVPFGTYLTCVYAAAAAGLGLMMIGSGAAAAAFPAHDALWLILMAAGPGVVGHGLLNWCVRRMRAYVVNAALLGEPILATLYAWLVFSEPPGFHLLAGGSLVVAGLAFVLHEERASAAEIRPVPAL